jgi:TPR repeat protein
MLGRPALALLVHLLASPACRADQVDIEEALRQGHAAQVLPVLRRLAEAGDANAAFNLGLLYDLGHGVPEDFVQAMAWYRRAAALGNATAAFNVGVLYDAGRGVPADRAEAARWYRLAADRGFGRADYNLGLMYLRGDGVGRDVARAKRYFQEAERRGVEAARQQLAVITKAEDAKGENAFAQAQAQILERGLPSVGSETVQNLQLAAQRGNPLAQYDLAYCYENGIGLAADRVSAFVWYSRSAKAPDNGPSASAATRAAATTGASAVWARMTETEQQSATSLLRQTAH